ncbi:MAG: hypothetical protein JOZ84_00295 [Methylobacteriaceae bacterium]|nr:hypothetical protein [Methylobacteriaceae bacterium]
MLLALGALAQSSSSAAARCPSGQILRVSQGICVPKAENLAILAKHGGKNGKPAEAAEDAPPPTTPKAVRDEANSNTNETRPVEIAQHDAPAPLERRSSQSDASSSSSALSPFGALFVGAFHSTLSAGMSAFR